MCSEGRLSRDRPWGRPWPGRVNLVRARSTESPARRFRQRRVEALTVPYGPALGRLAHHSRRFARRSVKLGVGEAVAQLIREGLKETSALPDRQVGGGCRHGLQLSVTEREHGHRVRAFAAFLERWARCSKSSRIGSVVCVASGVAGGSCALRGSRSRPAAMARWRARQKRASWRASFAANFSAESHGLLR